MQTLLKKYFINEINSLINYANKYLGSIAIVSILKQLTTSLLSLSIIALILINTFSAQLNGDAVNTANITLLTISLVCVIFLVISLKSLKIERLQVAKQENSILPEIIELAAVLINKHSLAKQQTEPRENLKTNEPKPSTPTEEKIQDLSAAIVELNRKIENQQHIQ